jgi:hypothetical protein
MPILRLSHPLPSWRAELFGTWRSFMALHRQNARIRRQRRDDAEVAAEVAANPFNWSLVP